MERPSSADSIARELAATQHGVVTRGQLRAAGADIRHVRQLAEGPRWDCPSDEVLRLCGSAPTEAQSVMIAVLDAGPGARLAYDSAASSWGLRGCPLLPVHAVRTASSRRRSDLAVVHRVRRLPERWVTVLDGVPIVRPELLAMQLFAVHRFGRAERLTERLWSSGLLSGRTLSELLDDLGASGRNGVSGLRQYLEPRGPGYTPPDSGLEARLMQILRDAQLLFRRQVHSGGDRWIGRVDFRHDWLPLIIEAQSRLHHAAQIDRDADETRLAALRASGFVVLELTDTLIWSDPAEVVRQVRAAIAESRIS